MTEQLSNQLPNIDKSLLMFLKDNYDIKDGTPLYNAAKVLIQRLWQGSICVSYDDLIDKEKYNIEDLNKEILLESQAIGCEKEVRPIIFNDNNLYIQRYFLYQKQILEKINLLENNNKLRIITGGPGTGKTTSLAKELVEIILNEKINPENILLAAPTGKAAYRMKEALLSSLELDENKAHTHWLKNVKDDIKNQLRKLESKTIHRMLGTKNYLSVSFTHSSKNPLKAEIIVIDECSMVDLPMMAKLLDAVPDNCYLFLVGDKNQLASIEAGSVFADVCVKYNKDQYIEKGLYKEKTVNFRAKSAPGIVKLSVDILNESEINFDNIENVKYNENLSLNELMIYYKALIKARIPEVALKSLKGFQILCSIKSGANGTININKELIKRIKKTEAKYTPIIINENNYSLRLFNGDVGIKDEDYAYFLDSDSVKKFNLLSLPSYDDAFAITIHKSQGSEYTRIAVVYPASENENQDQSIFTKELLYTAVTRAKKNCLIYGSKKLLLDSCKKGIYRASGIK